MALQVPTNLDMQSFRAKLDQFGQVARSCRFAVQILPAGNLLTPNTILLSELLFVCDSFEFLRVCGFPLVGGLGLHLIGILRFERVG